MAGAPPLKGIAAPTELQRELVADPAEARRMSAEPTHAGFQQRQWGFDSRLAKGVTFEEFTHWAKIERELEEEEHRRFQSVTAGKGFGASFKAYFTKQPYQDNKDLAAPADGGIQSGEKSKEAIADSDDGLPRAISPDRSDLDAEWRRASRALRTAGWVAVFYLITTDILGWGQCPYVFSNTGYGLGIGIFILMGLAAFVSGLMIWKTFLGLDSSRFPVVTFGDVFFRLFGPKTRHFINVLQALQMFLSVAVVQLGQTNIIAQLADTTNLCYIVCGIISLVVGMASGAMRSLKSLGWFCNAAVWINIVTFVMILGASGNFPDVLPAVQQGPLNKAWVTNPAPVMTFSGTPPPEYQPTDTNLFAAKFNGINSMVYAYSGAILFISFLSEMRHPMDFWKAMICAQLFISIVYIFFGAFVYSRYGQYSYVNINQVVQPVRLQIVANVLTLITGWLAVFLYFNVGMKVIYVEVGQEILGLPPITSSKGRILWWALGPVYWIVAFIVAMSVPEFPSFTNFVGGLFSLNFTYSFSGIMFAGYKILDGARLPGEGFEPTTGVTTRHDQGMKRIIRGIKKEWKWVIPSILFTMAGLATSGMGTWAAVLGLITAFKTSVTTSWSCVNPFKAQ